MTMKRWLRASATVLLGVVPATYLLFLLVVFVLLALAGSSDGIERRSDPVGVALLVLITTAASVGYVALLFAAWRRLNAWLVGGLLVGLAANAYAVSLLWNFAPNILWSWSSLYLLVSPALVALGHVAAYLFAHRQSLLRPRGAA